MRVLLRNAMVVVGSLVFSWLAFEAFISLEFSSGDMSELVAYYSELSEGRQSEESEEFFDSVDPLNLLVESARRIRFVYIPVVAAFVILFVAIAARGWHWVWMTTAASLSLVVFSAWAVGGGFYSASSFVDPAVYLGTGIGICTFVVRRKENRKQPTDSDNQK